MFQKKISKFLSSCQLTAVTNSSSVYAHKRDTVSIKSYHSWDILFTYTLLDKPNPQMPHGSAHYSSSVLMFRSWDDPMQRDISLRRPGAQRGFSSLYSLMRQFTRFPKTANRRAPLFLDCSYRGNSLHNAYQPNTGEMKRKRREREGEREREREREKERERATDAI